MSMNPTPPVRRSPAQLEDARVSPQEILQTITPFPRNVLGLVACAVVAYYIPLILIALTGTWVNELTDSISLCISCTILIIANSIGSIARRPIVVALWFVSIADGYWLIFDIRTRPWSDWLGCWPALFLTTAGFALNTWLYMKYREYAGIGQLPANPGKAK